MYAQTNNEKPLKIPCKGLSGKAWRGSGALPDILQSLLGAYALISACCDMGGSKTIRIPHFALAGEPLRRIL